MNTYGLLRRWDAWLIAFLSCIVPATNAHAGNDDSNSKKHRSVDMSEVPPDPRDEHVNLRFVQDRIGEGFKIRRSLHYSIIYNTSEEDVQVFEYAIEKTYRSCVNWCLKKGFEVEQPKVKMLTHFFNDFVEYQKYGPSHGFSGLSPNILGYYLPTTNYTYFYNYRNTPQYKNARLNVERQISQLADQLKRGDVPSEQKKQIREQIRRLRSITNFISTDGGEVTETTLQHEVSHQVLFNIGFHNGKAALQGANPRWFAEGMAQLFEPISTGTASNFGLVNKETAGHFRQVVAAKAMYPIDGFVSDIRFFQSGNVGGIAYPQAWALCHYLTRTKTEEFNAYVREINQRDGDFVSSPEKDLALFEKHFGKVDKAWTKRFLSYMDKVN